MKHGYETANCANYNLLKQFATYNRKYCTDAEGIMWTRLSNNQLGCKFRRQHIIGDYIVDFVCLKNKLIIEIDGKYHNSKQQQEEDKKRTEYLNGLGFMVVRFTNDEIIGNIDGVIETISQHIINNTY
jgi:very-short-patch-repair endonuclease